jgi:tetratricopeptide (TPR) repeat protein
MKRQAVCGLALLLALAAVGVRGEEKSPAERMLQGGDAARAAELEQQIERLWLQARFADAIKPAEALLALRESKQGEDHWEAVDVRLWLEMAKQVAKEPEATQKAVADVRKREVEAEQLVSQGKYREAEPVRVQALGQARKLLGDAHFQVGRHLNDLGVLQSRLGKLKDAEESHRQALAIFLKELPPEHPNIAGSYSNRGVVLQALGKWKDAEECQRKALEIQLKVLPPSHPDIATTYANLGVVQRSLGKLKEAEESQRKGLQLRLKYLPPAHPDIATSYSNLGIVQQNMGKLKEAEESQRKALEIDLKSRPPGHPNIAASYNSLGLIQREVGKLKEAEESHRKALQIRLQVLPPGHLDIASSYKHLGDVQYTLGKLREAEESQHKALEIFLKALPAGHAYLAISHNSLALVQEELGKLTEAEESFRKAQEIIVKALPPGHYNIAAGYNNLGRVQQELGKLGEAEESLRKAVEIVLKGLPAGHPNTATAYHNLGRIQQDRGELREAEESLRKALEISQKSLPPGHPDVAAGYTSLGGALRELGKWQEAEKLLRAAGPAFELARVRVGPGSSERVRLARRNSPYDLRAVCLLRLGRPEEAWLVAEANRARGLLDDLAAGKAESGSSLRERRARLEQLDRLILPLILANQLGDDDQARLKELVRERDDLLDTLARDAAERSRSEVYPLAAIQKQLPADAALVLWIDLRDFPGAADPRGDHWACVVRSSGPPRWVQLDGTGAKGAWTESDRRAAVNLRSRVARGKPDWSDLARRLSEQRLRLLEPLLEAGGGMPEVRHLVVIPTGVMAGVPVELLTDRYRVSYAPSATLLARTREQHRPLVGESLLALGDPAFNPAQSEPPLPPHGLLLTLVVPGGAAGAAGLRGGDVLLSYNGVKLNTRADLKPAAEGKDVPAQVWRDGKVLDGTLGAGKLGAVVSNDPAPVALRKQREAAVAGRGEPLAPLPASRIEVRQIAALFPEKNTVTLLGSDAGEQRLDELAADGGLKRFRVLHLATHGVADDVQEEYSHLALAADRLKGLNDNPARKKVYTGRLTVEEIRTSWELDADLVTLSACRTALGPDGGGEGLLGFSQALFRRGARSLVLSLWKVDDTATTLLMIRFYENLLGKRDGLKAPLGRLEALREARRWLRELPRAERDRLAEKLGKGVLRSGRGSEEPAGPVPDEEPQDKGERPYAHPKYWAAFVLFGDPD